MLQKNEKADRCNRYILVSFRRKGSPSVVSSFEKGNQGKDQVVSFFNRTFLVQKEIVSEKGEREIELLLPFDLQNRFTHS